MTVLRGQLSSPAHLGVPYRPLCEGDPLRTKSALGGGLDSSASEVESSSLFARGPALCANSALWVS